MSEKSWDDEDFEVPPPLPPMKVVDDKWDGEDEVQVKDNWDDEEEEPKKKPVSSAPMPKKKSKKQIIEEKQAAKAAALQAKKAELERMAKEMSPEEKLAEKKRIQQIQEESDLEYAVEMMGLGKEEPVEEGVDLKNVDLSNSAGLEAFGAAIIKKIRETERLEKKSYYVQFLEKFCKELCTNLEADEVNTVTSSLKTLFNEKLKANKPVKGKKKADKAKLQGTKKSGDDFSGNTYNDLDDLDDFM